MNQITEQQFVKLIEIKDKSNNKLFFNTNSSLGQSAVINHAGVNTNVINGVILNFNDAEGAKFAAQVLDMLGT